MVWSKFWLLLADDIHISSYFIYLQLRSQSNNECWMKAVVRRIHLSDSGSKLYDLNIREKADPSRIRPNRPQRLPPGSIGSNHDGGLFHTIDQLISIVLVFPRFLMRSMEYLLHVDPIKLPAWSDWSDVRLSQPQPQPSIPRNDGKISLWIRTSDVTWCDSVAVAMAAVVAVVLQSWDSKDLISLMNTWWISDEYLMNMNGMELIVPWLQQTAGWVFC